MEMQYFETVLQSPYREDIYQLLVMADKEFIPPLSCRGSSTQAELSSAGNANGITEYFDSMASQPVIVAVENERCMGFMAFKTDYTCQQIGPDTIPNLYASTCVVHPDARGKGMMQRFYQTMIDRNPNRSLCTRTWHTNYAHLKVLQKFGFSEIARLPDHRGPGLDTVYYLRKPDIT